MIRNNYMFPLNLEFSDLERILQERLNKQYHRRSRMIQKILTPGVCNKISNQSALNFEEPNTKPPYPLETIPYSQGMPWE